MRTKPAKLIGEVITLTGPCPGFAVRVTRYPAGRLLPAPRLILTAEGQPFVTAYAALEALNQYRAAPKSVKPLKARDPVPVRPPEVARPARVIPVTAERLTRLARETVFAAELRAAKLVEPPVVAKLPVVPLQRLTKALKKDALGTAHLIAHSGVTVTRCPSGRRERDSRRPVVAR